MEHSNEWPLLAESDGFQPCAPVSLVTQSVNDEGFARLTNQTSRDQASSRPLIARDNRPQLLEIETVTPENVTGYLSALFSDPCVFRGAIEHPFQRQAAVSA